MKENKKYSQKITQEELKSLRLEEFGQKSGGQGSSQLQTSNFQPQSPLIVPDGYFDSLPEQVMLQIQSLPDFESVAKSNAFAVPDGYFDSLPTIIQQRIIESKSKRFSIREWIRLWRDSLSAVSENIFVPKYSLALASVTLVVLFGVKFMSRTISVKSDSIQLSAAEISNSNYLYEMDESLFIDALAEQGSMNTNATDKSAEDYLIDNNIDLTSITEQL